ncbi:MAG TPA: iron chelate uptake ABC transporter family permease subunit, partial [Bacteroidales bacterium]|nr:iron chelate uptake ABC transporter family permease subunit [Bacteroidales bacterium]
MQVKSQKTTLFIFLFLLLAGAFVADLAIGSVAIPARDIVNILFTGQAARPEWRTILIDFRLPRAITAILAGTALSVSGLQMQTIFRNP